MRNRLVASLLTAVALVPQAAYARPVDALLGPILADVRDAAAINARCDTLVAELGKLKAGLEGEKGAATVAGTLQHYDDLVALLSGAGGEATAYRETLTSDALRQAGSACEVRIGEVNNAVSLSRPIYDRLKAIPTAKLDPATRTYLKRTLTAFEVAGVALPPEQRAKAQALSDKLAALGSKFDKNIADGRKTFTADPAELEGTPPDFIAAHKPAADGKITLSTNYTDYFPIMQSAKSEALRRRAYEAFMTRAYPANDAVLREILDTRQELATLLGKPDHASVQLSTMMLDTPAKVEKLLTDMDAIARPAGERDFARKLAMWRKDHPEATTYGAWNGAYLSQQVQKADYAYDAQEARQYFAYNRVRDGILRLTEQMFGVEIRPWATPVWDKAVEAYEMREKGRVIGRFYLDAHPREGKYEHANAVPLRAGIVGENGRARSVPVAMLVMNLSADGPDGGLLGHSDAVTFFHEYGHLIHHIFGGQTQRWAGQSGVATEWDFVEAPSQMLEEWMYDYDTLKAFAKNAKGEVIPRKLVDAANRARYFDLGMGDQRQLGLSNISLRLHQGKAPADLGARVRELDARFSLLPLPEWTQFQDSFGHLNGYGAVYYTYRWSKVIADDLFTRFQRDGLHNTKVAMDYRTKVLGAGGTKPAADLVKAFLGRPISLDAYKAELAKDK